jgi:hypothetical protein
VLLQLVVLHVVVLGVEQPPLPSSAVTLWQVLEQPQCAEHPLVPEVVDEQPVAAAATPLMPPPAISDPRMRESSRFTRPP